jgi:hypothetical protein
VALGVKPEPEMPTTWPSVSWVDGSTTTGSTRDATPSVGAVSAAGREGAPGCGSTSSSVVTMSPPPDDMAMKATIIEAR